jgi:zinc/manganese transport system substrate-binding protein
MRFLSLFLFSFSVLAKPLVMVSTTNIKSLVKEIAGSEVKVESFAKGTQDPHYLEAKPSYMIKASKADLVISIGLGLEEGWLPLIIRGARNPKIRVGESGHLALGNHIPVLEAVHTEVTRADGDVHPEGNPHFMLSPKMSLIAGEKIQAKLSELLPKKKAVFVQNFENYKKKLGALELKYSTTKLTGLKVITYHKTLTYLYDYLKINNVAILEPKPGIPPTVSHVLKVIKAAKKEG